MLCFEFLCLIDQRIKTGSGLDGVVESFRDMSYIVIAILVLSHYQLQDFRKYWFLYVEWVIFSIIGGILFVWKGEAVAMFPSNRMVLAVNLLLWGIAIIQTLVRIIAEKRRLDFIHKPFACIWLLMMADMFHTKNPDFIRVLNLTGRPRNAFLAAKPVFWHYTGKYYVLQDRLLAENFQDEEAIHMATVEAENLAAFLKDKTVTEK